MSKIVIGEASGKNVSIDLDLLLSTRMLLTADSGGGKTFALKRIVEQAFGKIQIIIIDPEGEFSPLREKLAFVLVGKGGETPADVRSAALVAKTLLKMRACAIVDLYEMKPSERHAYVRTFLEAMIEAPKELRHPCLVIVDEAHIFCPEHGKGESVAAEAMISLCTRGRKRLLCPLFATQRLATLSKDASSMLLNRMIGPTFEEINRKRAREIMGVAKEGQKEFYREIQTLEPGIFFCLGRAISKEMVLAHIGPIETPHGQNALRYEMKPPPAPEKIMALLPQLADLPKEAEEKAKNVAELTKQVRALQLELKQRPTGETPIKGQEKAVARATGNLRIALEGAMKIIAKITALGFEDSAIKAEDIQKALESASAQIVKAAKERLGQRSAEFDKLRREAASALEKMRRLLGDEQLEVAVTVKHNEPFTVTPPAAQKPNGNGDLATPERKILNALAWFDSIGLTQPKLAAVAFIAGYTVGGDAFNNPRRALRSKGLIEYRGDCLALTEAGREKAEAPTTPLSTGEMHQRVLGILPTPEQKLLRPLLEAHPDALGYQRLAELAGYAEGGGDFNNPRGRLRTLELVTYPEKGTVKASDWLFID